nr:hypothetical protein Iba_chr01bCG0170 [Ipomoea batatas]
MVSLFGKADESSLTSTAYQSICMSTSIKAISTFNGWRIDVSIKIGALLLSKGLCILGRNSTPTSTAFRSICVSSSVKAFSTFNDSRAEVSIKKVPSFSAKAFASSVKTAHHSTAGSKKTMPPPKSTKLPKTRFRDGSFILLPSKPFYRPGNSPEKIGDRFLLIGLSL